MTISLNSMMNVFFLVFFSRLIKNYIHFYLFSSIYLKKNFWLTKDMSHSCLNSFYLTKYRLSFHWFDIVVAIYSWREEKWVLDDSVQAQRNKAADEGRHWAVSSEVQITAWSEECCHRHCRPTLSICRSWTDRKDNWNIYKYLLIFFIFVKNKSNIERNKLFF